MQTIRKDWVPALDLLRLASALAVVLFHYGFRMGRTGEGGGADLPALAAIGQWGDFGILTFFVISGYVITLSAQGRSAGAFLVGRIARLWPGFVVCAGLTALVISAWPVPGQAAPTFEQWLAHGVIASRLLGQPFLDGAYWTIVYEFVFYGWVALFISLRLFDTRWKALLIVWIALSLANEALIGSGAMRKLLITEYSGFFAAGVALCRVMANPRDRGAAAILVVAALWASASSILPETRFIATYGYDRGVSIVPLIGLGAIALVALAALPRRLPGLPGGLVRFLGALTYPLYLLHQNIGYAAFSRWSDSLGAGTVLALLLLALLAASALVACFVEPAGKRLVRACAARIGRRPAEIAVSTSTPARYRPEPSLIGETM